MQKKIPKKITESYLRNAGLFYLERFSTSSANFKTVMLRKIKKSCAAHPEQLFSACEIMLNKVTQELIDKGFLNDAAYTQATVNSLKRRGLSKRLITQRLRQKGIKLEDVEGDDFYAAVLLTQRRKLGPFGKAGDEKQLQRAYGVLGRAGFDYAVCKKALSLTRAEADDVLNVGAECDRPEK